MNIVVIVRPHPPASVAVVAARKGDRGDLGYQGWAPVLGLVADGDRVVQRVTDWTGGEGEKPDIAGYVGLDGLVSDIADAVNVRGAKGEADGDNGSDGWSPILAVVEDGDRCVHLVTGWTGGTGDAPSAGLYVGVDGFVADIADAANIRGGVGEQGAKGDSGDAGPQGELGPKGDRGDEGPQGEQGPKGDVGDAGPQGEQGPKGDAGDEGPQGEQGLKGDAGDEGQQGEQGPKGDRGEEGPQGEQGPKGDVGDAGPQGEQGPKGDTGDAGPQGEQGAAGSGSIVPYLSLQGIDVGGPFDVSGLALQAISLDGVTASEFNMEDCDQLRAIQLYGLEAMNADTGADEYPVIKLAGCSGLKQFGCDIGAEVWEDDPDAEAPLPAPSDAISFAGLPIEWLDFSYTNLAYLDLSEVDTIKSLVLYSSTGLSVDIRHMTVLEQCELYDNAERNITTRIEAGGLTSLRYFRAMLYAVEFASFAGCTDIDELTMESNALTDIDITDVKASRVYLDFTALTQTAVDHVLMTLDASGAENGEVSMREGPAAPSPIMGMAAKIGLESKGWTVDVET